MRAVVDTNVAVVANGIGKYPDACVIACADGIDEIRQHGKLILDDAWRIIGEYQKQLRSAGQPGLGDAFLKWVLNNHANPKRCELVRITPRNDGDWNFKEFPDESRLAKFDRSDRKFIAVSAAHAMRPPVWQALDSEWWGYREVFKEHGITIKFLCPKEIEKSYNEKQRSR